MKSPHLLATACALILISFVSCKKDKDTTEDDSLKALEKQVQWKWQINKITTNTNFSGTEQKVTYDGQPTDYIDFRKDGKMYRSFQGRFDTADYFVAIVDNEKLINIKRDNVYIKQLTDQSMTLYDFDRESIVNVGFIEVTYHLTR
jgi:hypothetical protein